MTLKARPHVLSSEGELFLHPAPDGKVWLVRESQGCCPRVIMTFCLKGGVFYVDAPESLVPVNGPKSKVYDDSSPSLGEVERLRAFYEAAHPLMKIVRDDRSDAPWLMSERMKAVAAAIAAYDAVKEGGK